MGPSEPDIVHRTRVAVPWPVSVPMLAVFGTFVVWRTRLTHDVKSQLAALEKSAAAVKLPKSRFPIDLAPGFDALLPQLGSIKSLAEATSDLALLDVQAQRASEAARPLKIIRGLARTLDAEPGGSMTCPEAIDFLYALRLFGLGFGLSRNPGPRTNRSAEAL